MNAILYLGFNNPLKYKRGVENVIAVQASAIHNIRKFYFCFDTENSVFRWNEILGIAIKHNLFWPISFLLFYFRIRKKYNKILIHSHNYLFGSLVPQRIDVCSVHDGLTYQYKMTGKKIILPYYIIEIFNYLKSKKIHFVSEFSRQNANVEPFLEKTIIIYNSAALEQLINIIPNSEHPRPIVENPKRILIVRSIEERALIGLVLDVAARVSSLDFQFIIVGKGPLLELYKRKAKELNLMNLEFKGFVSDTELIKLYQNTHLVMVPAAYGEGFGLPVIEGYLFNKPVIASDVCALPEVIIHHDHLFSNTVDSIVSLLSKNVLYNDKFAFREYYFKRFGLDTIRYQYDMLYNSLI